MGTFAYGLRGMIVLVYWGDVIPTTMLTML